MNDVNKVIIVGKIVHIYTINQKRVILTVHTGGKDFPKVFALDSTAEYIINNCSIDTYVRIEENSLFFYALKSAHWINLLLFDELKLSITGGFIMSDKNKIQYCRVSDYLS